MEPFEELTERKEIDKLKQELNTNRIAYQTAMDTLVEMTEELSKIKQALNIAVDMLKDIDKTRSVANHKIGTQDKTLNSGIVFCWTTPDQIHNALYQIKQITETKE